MTLLPGLPAYIIFMCIRHTDVTNDEEKVKLSRFKRIFFSVPTALINVVKFKILAGARFTLRFHKHGQEDS